MSDGEKAKKWEYLLDVVDNYESTLDRVLDERAENGWTLDKYAPISAGVQGSREIHLVWRREVT